VEVNGRGRRADEWIATNPTRDSYISLHAQLVITHSCDFNNLIERHTSTHCPCALVIPLDVQPPAACFDAGEGDVASAVLAGRLHGGGLWYPPGAQVADLPSYDDRMVCEALVIAADKGCIHRLFHAL